MSELQMQLDDRAWLARLKAKAAEQRVPIAAMLELTSRCNLKCQHCYLGPQSEQHKKRALEMPTEEVKHVIDQLVDEGCLSLTITGGDPMMRKDFSEIYRYAREQGLLVIVFCDAILVSEKIVKLFAEYPPRKVEVSIYGATAETYEAVTRVKGSFERARVGIQRLVDLGVDLELKTVLMTLNQHELDSMREWADELGVSFRFDAAIFPCLPDQHSTEPLDLRVTPEDVVRKEMDDPRIRNMWEKKLQASLQTEPGSQMYSCGAGSSALYVSPQGLLSPCLMTTHHRFDLRKNSLNTLWNHDMRAFRDKKRKRSDGAFVGPIRGLCSHCPAFNYLETGDEEIESEYAMKLAELRLAFFQRKKSDCINENKKTTHEPACSDFSGR